MRPASGLLSETEQVADAYTGSDVFLFPFIGGVCPQLDLGALLDLFSTENQAVDTSSRLARSEARNDGGGCVEAKCKFPFVP